MRATTLAVTSALVVSASAAFAERDPLEFADANLNAPLTTDPTASTVSQDVSFSRISSNSIGSNNWTGFYLGGQLGYANVDTNVSSSSDNFIGGFTGGYDYDLGQWVVGAALDYDFTDASVAGGAADLETVFRVKARGGVKIGGGLFYGTAGYALADTDVLGSDDGYFIGAGYEYRVNQSFSVGVEALYHEFDNFNSTDVDVDATTVQVRGTFRF